VTDSAIRPIISADELSARIDEPRLRIADVRWFLGEAGRGHAEYAAGHIRGAVFVDLERDLSAASGPGRHPLPHPTAFADRLGHLGFGDEHSIVVYDQSGGTVAGRLWWMLERLGHLDVALLDGGLPAWLEAGGETTPIVPTPLRSRLTLATEWPGTIDRDEVWARTGDIDLIDLRDSGRYRGDADPVDGVPGHIPGARSRPATTLLDDSGRLLPPERLQVLLRAHGYLASAPTVMSCGSGVAACFGALAARVAGLADPLIYPGSYSDWVGAGLPVAVGDEPFEPTEPTEGQAAGTESRER
jgi:thiosulfate/3-mercaptopyruvate sulfurtransferase